MLGTILLVIQIILSVTLFISCYFLGREYKKQQLRRQQRYKEQIELLEKFKASTYKIISDLEYENLTLNAELEQWKERYGHFETVYKEQI